VVVNGLRLLSAGLLMAGLSCQFTQSEREACHAHLDAFFSNLGPTEVRSACFNIALNFSCESPLVLIKEDEAKCRNADNIILLSCLYEFLHRAHCESLSSRAYSARF